MSDGITNRLFNESDPNLRPTVPPGDTRLTDEGENGHNRQTTLGRRFVQLPTDTERSSKTGYLAASSAVVTLEHHHPIRQEELLGSLFALLHRYTQQTNIALDVCIRNGATACQIALDVEVASDLPASSVIESARLAFLIAIPPLVDMGRPSNIAASLTLASSETGGGLDTVTDAPSSNNNYDAHFILTQTPAAVLISLAYNARLLRPATVSRLIGSYIALLKATLNDHTITIEQLPLLSPEEKQALAVGLDSGAAFHPLVPAHRLFESQARQQPTVVAASFQGHHLTYRDLDERSSQLAHHLITCGVGPEIPVAVCLQPCLDVLVAMLAIWKARGIYLPLDPSHPEAFIGRMLDETQPRLALTTATLSGLTGRLPHFCFDTDAELIQKQPRTAPPIQPSLTDPAYIFYTSGTTGKAKGVVALHSNLVQYIQSAAQKYNFSATDTFASIARYTFSISLFELMSPLCCGGNLRILDRNEVLSPERLCRALKDVTVLHAGPSLLGSLFRYLDATRSAPRTFPRMRHASSGGDMVTPKVMEGMKRVFPNAELFVIYGCTEVSCMGTSYSIDREATVNRTIVGKPFSNVMLRIVDSNRNLVPFGVVGEICFAGKGIVQGYRNRPELTAERFAEIDGHRFYQTGDLGRLHPDGYLEILGRRDFQVQLRGIRIELAGIEKTVMELGLAAQCAVVAKTRGEGDVRLVAFVVNPRNDKIVTFRRALAMELPDYMLPHHVEILKAMPLTANGKLDRARLKEMPWQTTINTAGKTAPANEREQKIADVFARVLGLREVGVEENFFDLGGDSLVGALALVEIEQAIKVAIPPQILFESGTVRALANYHASVGPGEPKPILLNSETTGVPLFMLSGVHIYKELARRLDGQCSAYGVFTRRELGVFDPTSGFQSVEDLARDYLQIIRSQQPTGPYRLLGYSFSGLVAYEVAQQLRAAGGEIQCLALVDTHIDQWSAGWKYRFARATHLRSAHLRHVASSLWRRIQTKKGKNHGKSVVYHDDEELGLWDMQRGVANNNAAAQYVPRIRPAVGTVLLFASARRLRENPFYSQNCGWSRHIPALAIHLIDADHFQMMKDDPHVMGIAEILAQQMRTEPPGFS